MSNPVSLFDAFERHLESRPDEILFRYLVEVTAAVKLRNGHSHG